MIFSFENPIALIFILLVPVFVYLYKQYIDQKKKAALKFSSLTNIKKSKTKKKNYRMHLPFILTIVALSLIVIGLADPHIPLKKAKEGVNVVLAIDDSGSMSAQDYSPTRLEAAKDAAEILIKSLENEDMIGIVIFESGATTSAYLTPFKDKAISKLKAIQQREGRTAIGDGLSLAIDMATSVPNKKKVVILLSDGVNTAGVISPEEAIAFARSNKIQVYTVGMGSEGNTFLGYDMFGRPQYAELDEATLKAIAEQTGGEYFRSVDKNTLDEIYQSISEKIDREWENSSIKDWVFVLALMVLAVNLYLIYVKYRIVV